MPKEKVKPSAEQEIRRVLNEQGPEKSGLSDNFTLALAGILPTVVGSLFAGSRGAEVGANVGLGAMQQYGNQLNRQAQMDADKERFRKEQLIRGALADIPEELTPYQQEQLALDKRGLALREKQFAADQKSAGFPSSKELKEQALTTVPGFEKVPGVESSPAEVAKLRDSLAKAKSVEDSITRLQQLTEKQGPFEYFGETGAEMQALSTGVLMDLKDLQQLGVLAGPDMALLEKQIGDPTSLSSAFTLTSTRQKQLDTTLNKVKTNLQKKLESSGYKSIPSIEPSNSSELKQPLSPLKQKVAEIMAKRKGK